MLVFSGLCFGLGLGAHFGSQGRLSLHGRAGNQTEIASAKPQPNGIVQPSLHVDTSSTQAGLDLCSWDRPTLAVPMDGVVVGHGAWVAETKNRLKVVSSAKWPVSISRTPSGLGEPFVPLR